MLQIFILFAIFITFHYHFISQESTCYYYYFHYLFSDIDAMIIFIADYYLRRETLRDIAFFIYYI